MRVLLVSDVHANVSAFDAVLGAAESGSPLDQVWCLGDLVGYGPEPDACIRRLQEFTHLCVAGNHDRAATGEITTEEFNPEAAIAAEWTERHLGDEAKAFLRALPEIIVEGDFTLVHGSLRDPLWEYLVSEEAAAVHFGAQATTYSLVGHSHLQLAFAERAGGRPRAGVMRPESRLALEDTRLITNPGSAGQPRDGDPRAAFALLDTDSSAITYHRVEYDIERTQRAMAAAGLPLRLIARLSVGR